MFFTLNLHYEQSLKNKIEHPVVQYVWYMYIFNFNLIESSIYIYIIKILKFQGKKIYIKNVNVFNLITLTKNSKNIIYN